MTVSASVVFVHGLRGDAYETWTSDKICWPKDFLKDEPKFKSTRIINVMAYWTSHLHARAR